MTACAATAPPPADAWTLDGLYVVTSAPSRLPFVAIRFAPDGTFVATPAGCDRDACVERGAYRVHDDHRALDLETDRGTTTFALSDAVLGGDEATRAASVDLTPGSEPLLVAKAVKLNDDDVHLVSSCSEPLTRTLPSGSGGAFCFFVRFDSAFGMGHMGCGFMTGNDGPGAWSYGGIENLSGKPADDANDGWNVSGTYDEMVSTFRSGSRVCRFAQEVPAYDAMKCAHVDTPRIDAANQVLRAFPARGYSVIGNNCLDACAELYGAYSGDSSLALGVAKLTHPAPGDFFCNALGAAYWHRSTFQSAYEHLCP